MITASLIVAMMVNSPKFTEFMRILSIEDVIRVLPSDKQKDYRGLIALCNRVSSSNLKNYLRDYPELIEGHMDGLQESLMLKKMVWDIEGADYTKSTTALDNCRKRVATILDEGKADRLLQIAFKMSEMLTADANADVNALMRERNAIRSSTSYSSKMMTMAEMIDEAEKIGDEPAFLTGIHELDRFVSIISGSLVVLAGAPSAGKTALVMQILLAWLRSNTNLSAMFFSLETTGAKIRTRFQKLIGKMFPDINCNKMLRECNLKFSHEIRDIDEIVLEVESELKINEGLRFVIIDYLQMCDAQERTEYDNVTKVSKALKLMATKHNLIVVALSQLDQSSIRSKPTMQSIRSSGQIFQDADYCFMCWLPHRDADRSRKYKRVELIVEKVKDGALGTCKLSLHGPTFSLGSSWIEAEAHIDDE